MHLNFLQGMYTEQLLWGDWEALKELKLVQKEITDFYENESSKIMIESKTYDIESSEKTRIFHHSNLRSKIKKSQITKLMTGDGIIVGQKECHEYLEKEVKDILSSHHHEDEEATNDLLKEVDVCVTEEDNTMLKKIPDENEVKEVIRNSNLQSAPGRDGIPVLLYSVCWDIIGESMMEMIRDSKGKVSYIFTE